MRMLRWMFCAIKSDRIRNTYMKRNLGVTDVSENRLKRFGHVEGRNNNELITKIGEIKVDRKRGRDRSQN